MHCNEGTVPQFTVDTQLRQDSMGTSCPTSPGATDHSQPLPEQDMAVTPTQHLPAPEKAALCQLLAQALRSPFHPHAPSNLNVSAFVPCL